MSSISKRMPSASMVVALIALFVALGGSALAVHLGRNAVKSRNIKPGAVHTSDLHRKAVRTTKIANGAVKTIKLAPKSVTTAKLADEAVNTDQIADGAVGATQLAPDSVGNSQAQLVKVFEGGTALAAANQANAPRVELGSVGPFRFYGKCFFVAGQVEAAQYIELTSGTATLGSEDGASFANDAEGYLTSGRPEEARALESVATLEPNSFNAASAGEAFQASASDGTRIVGLASGIGAKIGNPPGGNGPFAAGDSCILGALAVFGG